jgi:hypothetical protein
MVRDRINAMAFEAGMYQTEDASGEILWVCDQEELERFAALVAAAEREACAQIAEEWLGPTRDRELHIAAAIRARSQP